MKKVMIAAVAVLASAGASGASAMAPDAAAKAKTVTIEGATLDYVSTVGADGLRHLSGTETSTGRRFDFRVTRSGYVSGTVDGKRVAFSVPRANRAATLARQQGAGLTAGSR